jgi:hypothetical protein
MVVRWGLTHMHERGACSMHKAHTGNSFNKSVYF